MTTTTEATETQIVQISEEWEVNGYDDSDFLVATLDLETGEIGKFLTGSTRFAGGFSYPARKATAEEMDRAEAALAVALVEIVRADSDAAQARDALVRGARVRTIKEISNRPREATEVECPKCAGSGKWTNSWNPSDKRPCFKCSGTGKVTQTKACKGKAVKTPVGTVGTVVQVFDSGYGCTVVVRTDDGREFRAAPEAVRAGEALTDERAAELARTIARGRNFRALFDAQRALYRRRAA